MTFAGKMCFIEAAHREQYGAYDEELGHSPEGFIAGWQHHCENRIESHTIESTHLEMIHGEHAKTIALILNRLE